MKQSRKRRLDLIRRYDLVTLGALQRVCFDGQAHSTIRGAVAEDMKDGLVSSHTLPGHDGECFYFLTRNGARTLGVNTKLTHKSKFPPRSLYTRLARMTACTQQRIRLGIETPLMFRPAEFQASFPELADGAPDRYYAQDRERTILELHPIALPDIRRCVATLHKRFHRYLEHNYFKKLIAAKRFQILVIAPSAGVVERIKAENLLRESRLEQVDPEKKQQLAFLRSFRKTLRLWASEDLGKLL